MCMGGCVKTTVRVWVGQYTVSTVLTMFCLLLESKPDVWCFPINTSVFRYMSCSFKIWKSFIVDAIDFLKNKWTNKISVITFWCIRISFNFRIRAYFWTGCVLRFTCLPHHHYLSLTELRMWLGRHCPGLKCHLYPQCTWVPWHYCRALAQWDQEL